jgi:TRAP-type C4-dicarboxylate transport system permease small subunit
MFLRGLDRLIGCVVAAAKWLALPLITLLFLQWPLRELFRGYSREANDLGQVVFALFVAVSITAATRAGTHLAVDQLAQGTPHERGDASSNGYCRRIYAMGIVAPDCGQDRCGFEHSRS